MPPMKSNTLPAPLTAELAALTYAREFLASMREGDFIGLGLPPWHDDTGHAFARLVLMTYALQHPFNLDHVVECATAGWLDAEIVVHELGAYYRHHRIALPLALEAYEMRRTNPRIQRP